MTHIQIGYGPDRRLGWWYVLDGSTHSVSGFRTREAAAEAAQTAVVKIRAELARRTEGITEWTNN